MFFMQVQGIFYVGRILSRTFAQWQKYVLGIQTQGDRSRECGKVTAVHAQGTRSGLAGGLAAKITGSASYEAELGERVVKLH